MPHSFGYRARTRDMFARDFGKNGVNELSIYLRKYKVFSHSSSFPCCESSLFYETQMWLPPKPTDYGQRSGALMVMSYAHPLPHKDNLSTMEIQMCTRKIGWHAFMWCAVSHEKVVVHLAA